MNGTIRGAVAVLEAGGVIGRGLVAAALEAGYPVLAVERSADARAALEDLHGTQAARADAELRLIQGSARHEADARALAETLRAAGRPIVAILAAVDAGQLRGRLLDQSVELTCAALSASLAPQLAAARHLLPLLSQADRSGSFVLVGGPGGRHPWAGYSQRSLTEAALRMLARILHDEAGALGARFQLLSVETPTCGLHGGPPRAHWPSALDIGQRAMELIQSRHATGAVVEFAAPRPPALSPTQLGTAPLQPAPLKPALLKPGATPPTPQPAMHPSPLHPCPGDVTDGLQSARVLLARLPLMLTDEVLP